MNIFSGNKEELGWRWTLNLYDGDITPLPGPTDNLAVSQKEFRYLFAELTEENEDLDDIWMNITLIEMV